MADINDEQPQADDEAQDAPEVIAHGIEDEELANAAKCTVFIEL